jgi:hypothetical protein
MKERIAAWKLYVEERITYWEFAQKVSRDSGLCADIVYCTWKRIEFEDLLDALNQLQRKAA